MRTARVVILWDMDKVQMARLRAAAPGLVISQPATHEGEEALAHLREAEVVLCSGARFDLAQAPELAWVQVASAGVNHLPVEALQQRRILLTTASGIHAVPIGEHVLAMMLGWVRRMPLAQRWQAQRLWRQDQPEYRASELRGATAGIVGYGSIGRHVARLASAFGMRVLAYKRQPGREDMGWVEPGSGDPAGEIPERFYGPGELAAMLPLCDHVVIAVPLTPETRHLIGARELAAMKPGAFLINIARGPVVDEPALIRALEEGKIAGAGLDVFEAEPLPADNPLYRLDNVILTPHVAGTSSRYNERLAQLFADNLSRYTQGQPLLNQVDLEKGY